MKRKEGLSIAPRFSPDAQDEREQPPHLHGRGSAPKAPDNHESEDEDLTQHSAGHSSGAEGLGKHVLRRLNDDDSIDKGEEEEETAEPVQKKARTAGPSNAKRRTSKDSRAEERSKPVPDRAASTNSPQPEAEKRSLRELTRQAYSRASLHTHKANSLHKRKAVVIHPHPSGGQSKPTSIGQDRDNSRGTKGARRGRGTDGAGRYNNRDSDKGQPNMKLRMEAVLERIKRDYT